MSNCTHPDCVIPTAHEHLADGRLATPVIKCGPGVTATHDAETGNIHITADVPTCCCRCQCKQPARVPRYESGRKITTPFCDECWIASVTPDRLDHGYPPHPRHIERHAVESARRERTMSAAQAYQDERNVIAALKVENERLRDQATGRMTLVTKLESEAERLRGQVASAEQFIMGQNRRIAELEVTAADRDRLKSNREDQSAAWEDVWNACLGSGMIPREDTGIGDVLAFLESKVQAVAQFDDERAAYIRNYEAMRHDWSVEFHKRVELTAAIADRDANIERLLETVKAAEAQVRAMLAQTTWYRHHLTVIAEAAADALDEGRAVTVEGKRVKLTHNRPSLPSNESGGAQNVESAPIAPSPGSASAIDGSGLGVESEVPPRTAHPPTCLCDACWSEVTNGRP